MKLELSNLPIDSLVEDWPRLKTASEKDKCLFITISPAPHVRFSDKALRAVEFISRSGKQLRKKSALVKRITTYGSLPQKCQFKYCISVFESLYSEFLGDTEFVGTWELNEKGNVHLHVLLYSPSIQTPTQLSIFRRDIYNHEISIKSHKGKKDYMNNIVFTDEKIKTREELLKYMDKDFIINTGDGINFNFVSLMDNLDVKPPPIQAPHILESKKKGLTLNGRYLKELSLIFN